jgi:hypothetical protein
VGPGASQGFAVFAGVFGGVLEKVVFCGWFFVVKTWWNAW